ncbi:hypothetical protein GCK32_022542 [Trichostrongylus colubriformis]|uniref:Uncharacterized protein n=1 Tax=Trichostrongylus colubriformis TaxID=6319 RepID=A0AAN8EXA0_TRICO
MSLYYVLVLALIIELQNGMVSSQQSYEDNRRAAGLGPLTLGRYAAREEYIQEYGYPNKDRTPATLVEKNSGTPLTAARAAAGLVDRESRMPMTAARAAQGFHSNRWD